MKAQRRQSAGLFLFYGGEKDQKMESNQTMRRRVLRPKRQCELLDCSMATLYRLDKQPNFPKAFRIGANSTGRFEDELIDYLEGRRIGEGGK